MRGKLLSYSGIAAKIKAMESHIYKADDYVKIANYESVPEFITLLKNNPAYEKIFSGYEENSLHRGQIEHMLMNSYFQDYSRIYSFSNEEQRKALAFPLMRLEINILKSCLLHVFNHEYKFQASSCDEELSKHMKINIEQLSNSNSIDEFINFLKDSEYYNLFKAVQNKKESNLFDYQIQLDIHYFKKIWKLKDKFLSGINLQSFEEIIGKKIDLLNILWIYRSKKYYNIDASKIYSCIIPITYKLNKKELASLIETGSIEELLTALSHTYYSNVFGSIDFTSFEQLYRTLLNKIYKINMRKYPNSMAPVDYYLYLKEMEIDKLTTVLECLRYKLEPTDTLKYVQ